MNLKKSNNKDSKSRKATLENVMDHVWRNDDLISTIGISLAVMALFQLTCVISMLL